MVKALVEPNMLKWAREQSKLSIENAATQQGIGLEILQAWESGEESLLIRELKIMADVYDIPIAAFYLTEPPQFDIHSPALDEIIELLDSLAAGELLELRDEVISRLWFAEWK